MSDTNIMQNTLKTHPSQKEVELNILSSTDTYTNLYAHKLQSFLADVCELQSTETHETDLTAVTILQVDKETTSQ